MCRSKAFIACIYTAFGLQLSNDVVARSSVSLERGQDNNDGQNYYVSGRLDFEKVILKAGSGKSTSIDSTGVELASDSQTFGIQSDSSKLFNFSLDSSSSTQINIINNDSLALTMEMNTVDWNVFISSEKRDHSVKTMINNSVLMMESNGKLAGITYYGWDPYYVSYSATTYDYNRRLSALSTRVNFFSALFGPAAFDQVFAFEDKRSTIELGYYFDNASLAFSQSEGRSAVDQSIATSNKIIFDYNLSKDWGLGVTIGSSKLDISDGKTNFGSISIKFQW